MYLSKLGFFRKKITNKNQQVTNYLNLLTSNLKNDNLKRSQLAYLQQEINCLKLFLTSRNAVIIKQKRLSNKLKSIMQKRRAKKRFILRNNHKMEAIGINKQQEKILPHQLTFAGAKAYQIPDNLPRADPYEYIQ